MPEIDGAALLAAIQSSNKEMVDRFESRFTGIEHRLDNGLKNMQEQIDQIKHDGCAQALPNRFNGVKSIGAVQLALQHAGHGSHSGSSTRDSNSAEYEVNPLRVLLFGLAPAKSRAQLKTIASSFCHAHGIVPVRVLAAPGKTFCSVIVANEAQAAKCFQDEVTVTFAG